jgi:hypothetical protein
MKHDDFKENAEGLATMQFLPAYNSLNGTQFEVRHSDEVAPDVRCVDRATGAILNIEITLATRSPVGPLTWKQMRAGMYKSPGPSVLDLEGELAAYRENIVKKFRKRYGKNTALLVFQWGPVMPWNVCLDHFRSMIDFSQSPFNLGVWMLSWGDLLKLDK